jgi:phosphoribosyl 1,2-cyclic phosphodiesterase
MADHTACRIENPLLLRFWGVRGSIPAPGPETAHYGGNTSCMELRLGNEVLILDAGSGIRRLGLLLASERETKPLQTTLLISHTHWDHIQGLPFFRPAYDRESQMRILGAPGTRERLHTALVRQMDPIQFPIPLECLRGITEIDEFASASTSIGSFSVQTIGLNHPGGCTGFKITSAGRSIAYLPDHESYRVAIESSDSAVAASGRKAEIELTEFLAGCDLLILDAQYSGAEYSERIGWGHGCVSDSVSLAMRAGVERLILFHHDPNHDDIEIDSMLSEARWQVIEAGSQLRVEAAREREEIFPHFLESNWLPNESRFNYGSLTGGRPAAVS